MSPVSTEAVKQPTVVLVHGAYADSSSWNDVICELHGRGYNTIAAANPLRGLQHDAAYLRNLLEVVPGPVVLAGHSYGGSVMSQAADGCAGVAALVYAASFQLDVGERTDDLVTKFPGAQLGSATHPVAFQRPDGEDDSDLYVDQDRFWELFAGDVAPHIAAQMAVTQRPIAASALFEPATKAAWKTIPSWSLIATQDLAIPVEASRFMASRADATAVEIDASHAVTVSQPVAVADLIDIAAKATTGRSSTSVAA